jgi:hypothetical protein
MREEVFNVIYTHNVTCHFLLMYLWSWEMCERRDARKSFAMTIKKDNMKIRGEKIYNIVIHSLMKWNSTIYFVIITTLCREHEHENETLEIPWLLLLVLRVFFFYSILPPTPSLSPPSHSCELLSSASKVTRDMEECFNSMISVNNAMYLFSFLRNISHT